MTDRSRLTAAVLIVAGVAPAMVGMAAAFRTGPFAPDLDLGMILGSAIFALFFGFAPALVIILTIALPIYLTLRRWWPMRWWHAALAGALIGTLLACLDGFDFPQDTVVSLIGMANGLLFRAVIGRDPRQWLSA